MERFDIVENRAWLSPFGDYVRYSKARAEIERLEKDVEFHQQENLTLQILFDKVAKDRDTAWSDAIDAAVNLVDFDEACVDGYVKLWAKDRIEAILSLKRCKE